MLRPPERAASCYGPGAYDRDPGRKSYNEGVHHFAKNGFNADPRQPCLSKSHDR